MIITDNLYFSSFEFSPAVTLRIDYQGASRVNLAGGAVQGLFIGLSQLNCTQLTLKELHYRQVGYVLVIWHSAQRLSGIHCLRCLLSFQ